MTFSSKHSTFDLALVIGMILSVAAPRVQEQLLGT